MQIKDINSIKLDDSDNKIEPKSIVFDITDRCQMKCVTCSKWQTPSEAKNKELSTQEWKDIILDIKKWIGRYAFIISGGEPFLRSDIFEIIDYAGSIDLPVTVISNAFLVKPFIDRIIESPISSFIVSLNALDPEKHDRSRGVIGSFDKAREVIKKINEAKKLSGKNIKLNISTIVIPEFLDQIVPLINWVVEEGLDGISFQLLEDDSTFHSYFSIRSLDANAYEENQKLLNAYGLVKDETLVAINKIIEMKQGGAPVRNSYNQLESMKIFINEPNDILNVRCRVGHNNIFVDPYGDVRICGNFDPVGNYKEGIKSLILSDEANLQRKFIDKCKMFCRLTNCNFKKDK